MFRVRVVSQRSHELLGGATSGPETAALPKSMGATATVDGESCRTRAWIGNRPGSYRTKALGFSHSAYDRWLAGGAADERVRRWRGGYAPTFGAHLAGAVDPSGADRGRGIQSAPLLAYFDECTVRGEPGPTTPVWPPPPLDAAGCSRSASAPAGKRGPAVKPLGVPSYLDYSLDMRLV